MQPGLVGEAGVGKTRLVEEAAESAREAGDMAALVVVGVAGVPVVLAPALAALATVVGAGSVISEVVCDTCLQRSLDPAVFARAYRLVVPAYVAAIAAGALLAPLSVSIIGAGGTPVVAGLVVVAYGALLVAQTRLWTTRHTFAPGSQVACDPQ
jgi:hypothetical protein